MTKKDPTAAVLQEVRQERVRQDQKWGEQNHDQYVWTAILTEEVGEVARAACERNAESMREELLHVAAVAVAIVECMDRTAKGQCTETQ